MTLSIVTKLHEDRVKAVWC